MNPRFRFAVPLVACLVLGGTLLWALRDVSSASSPEPSAAAPSPSTSTSSPSVPGPSVPPASAQSTAAAGPAPAASQDLAAVAEPPESEGATALPQENDPIEPEQPQTAAWRHEKLVRITQLLDRDVERLEAERQAARARGNEVESRRLAVQLARHRARLGSLREETTVMADAARQEEQAR